MNIILNIGVLGRNLHHSELMLREIIKNDQDSDINKFERYKGFLKDGTQYRAISYSENVRGMRLDQLFILDKEVKYTDFYNEVILPMLVCSCVPEEFIVQVYPNEK